jgi:ABC-type phosphate/phosphonate transport system substrate-binding protein
MLAGAGVVLAVSAASYSQNKRLLLGVSSDTLAGANIGDARAAAKIWAQQITRELGINQAEMYPDVFIPSAQMIRMIQEGTIDCFVLTAWEYARAAPFIDPEWILVESKAPAGMEYVLLVHQESSYHKLEELRGRQLTVHHHRDTVMLNAWISILLAKSGQATLDRFFGRVVLHESLTQVVAPLFFRRIDVAALTAISFRMAAELNPQLGKDLRILATSPKVIPEVFCFRRGCTAEAKRSLIAAFSKVKSLTAGQQILALYQTEGYEQQPGKAMQGTLQMVREYEHLVLGSLARTTGP